MIELAGPTAVPIRKPLFFARRRFAPPAWLLVLVLIPAKVQVIFRQMSPQTWPLKLWYYLVVF